MRLSAAALAAAAVAAPSLAYAGAWPLPPGETQLILKYERQTADEGYDPEGVLRPIFDRSDESLSLWVERGLTDRLTFQGRASVTRGEDGFVEYEGRGPVELGVRAAVLRNPRNPVSVYLGVIAPGEGRNAGYAPPDQGDGDVEARVLAGRSGVWRGRAVFAEAQAAHLWRSDLPDEVRTEGTLGVHFNDRWLLLAQSYAGTALVENGSTWLKGEVSLVRRFGDWRVQAGWRQTLSGREAPRESGPVLALWRRF